MTFFKRKGDRKHFGLGFLVSWIAGFIVFCIWNNHVLTSAILANLVASIIWELIHLDRSPFSIDDIFKALCGGLIATLFWAIILLTNPDWTGIIN